MLRLLLLLFLTCIPINAVAIDETAARALAETAAGCNAERPCLTRARRVGDRWVLVVSFIQGYRENGEPLFLPGGFVGITLDQEGNIVDRMPGA